MARNRSGRWYSTKRGFGPRRPHGRKPGRRRRFQTMEAGPAHLWTALRRKVRRAVV